MGANSTIRATMRTLCVRLGWLRLARYLWSTLMALLLLAALPHSYGISGGRARADEPARLCDSASGIPRAECEALIALYTSTDGPHWSRRTGWLETSTPCTWYGVTCHDGHVTSLELARNGLGGTIPSELGNLGYLQYLGLASNELTGRIPPQLGNLSSLTMLILYDNQLSGPIPPELGNLASLTHLRLYTNRLSGSIPPELGRLSRLAYLVLKSNQLSGSIPAELGNLADTLKVLYLSCNQLSGEVPRDIVNLDNLHSTDLGYNMLRASNSEVIAFLDDKDPDWAQTQTVAPRDAHVVKVSDNSVELAWTPVAYTGGGGYYEVSYATTPSGPYTVHGTMADKSAGRYLAADLASCPAYYFVVRTYTPAHERPGQYIYQQSNLWSDYSHEVPTSVLLLLPLVVQGSS